MPLKVPLDFHLQWYFFDYSWGYKMSQINSVELEKSRVKTAHAIKSESDVIQEIKIELSLKGRLVNNKAIMAKLLERLEIETDVVKSDIYRNALETVVFRTPDDLI